MQVAGGNALGSSTMQVAGGKVEPDGALVKSDVVVKPNAWHKLIVKRPILLMACIYGGMMSTNMLLMGMNPGLSLSYNSWFDLNALHTRKQLAHQARLLKPPGAATVDAVLPERSTPFDMLTLIYESKDNLLTPEKLNVMSEIEASISGLKDMPSWCLVANATDGTCAPFVSLLTLAPTLSTTTIDSWDTSTWCTGSADSQSVAPWLSSFVGSDFDCATKSVKYMKAVYYIGGPLKKSTHKDIPKDYANNNDEQDVQYQVIGNSFVIPSLLPVMDAQEKKARSNGIKIYWGSPIPTGGIMFGRTFSFLYKDMLFALGSITVVFLWIWFTTGSAFIAGCGMTHVMFSIPIAYTLWVLVASSFIGFMQFMGLFVILGIGADDIFIFYDAFLQSHQHPHPGVSGSPLTRLTWAYNRAAGAMFVTSLTSAFAFLATAISPIPAVYSFGATMAFMVVSNYVLVITWFPCACVIYERYVSNWCTCCCTKAGGGVKVGVAAPMPAVASPAPASPAPAVPFAAPPASPPVAGDDAAAPAAAPAAAAGQPPTVNVDKLGYIQKKFHTIYFDFISKPAVRRAILVALAVWYLVAVAVPAAELEVTGDFPAQFRRDDHPVNEFVLTLDNKFAKGEGAAKMPVTVFFGVDPADPIDRDGLDPLGSEYGAPNEDPAFDLAAHASQAAVLALCNETALAMAAEGLVVKGSDGAGEVYCFMHAFLEYLAGAGLAHDAATAPLLVAAEGPCVAAEAAGGQKAEVCSFAAFLDARKQLMDATGRTYDTGVQVAGGRAVHAHITFNTTLPLVYSKLTLSQFREEFDKYQAHLDAHNEKHPQAVAQQFAVYWYFMVAGEAILRSTVQGVSISLVFALLVLLATTLNWAIAVMALSIILLIVLTVSTIIVAAGWTVDFLGSICLIVVIGLAVDYTVHLMHAYNESVYSTRADRTRDALTSMGVSVVSGAITTFGAAMFLVPCQLAFFHNFGLYMVMTIIFSIFMSLVFLMASCRQFGPQMQVVQGGADGKAVPVLQGDLRPYLKALKAMCGKKQD